MAKKRTHYLDIYRAEMGRSHKISRTQLQTLLITLADRAGLDLRGHAGLYGVMASAALEEIARAIANRVQDSTVISIGGNIRDIQYDQPGSLDPAQRSQISFASAALAAGNHDYDPERDPGSTMRYLRQHAARVVTITGDVI